MNRALVAMFGAVVLAIGLGGVPLGQELVFAISLTVIALMLYRITADLDAAFRRRIFYAALVIFLYRAAPGVGEGYRWFTIDMLGFDEAFYGTLAQIGAGLALALATAPRALFADAVFAALSRSFVASACSAKLRCSLRYPLSTLTKLPSNSAGVAVRLSGVDRAASP